jgi:hypothetical protein
MNRQKLLTGLFLTGFFCLILLGVAYAESVQAGERQATVAEGAATTLIPTTSSNTEAGALELLAQEGGQITAVVSDGSYLYVNSGPRLAILSLEANPQLIGRSDLLPDNVQNVALSGQTAVVTTYNELFTMDLGDPSQPIILGTLLLDYGIQEILTAGSLAYVVRGSEIAIVDVGDPAQPQLAGTVETTPGWAYSITAAAVTGDLLIFREEYEIFYPHGGYDIDRRLVLVDVSSPDQAVVLAEILLDETHFIHVSLLLDGDFLFVVENSSLRVLDVSDPANPAWVASTSLPAAPVTAPVVHDGIMTMLTWDELTLVDVSTPTAPALLARFPLPVRGHDLALAGDLVAVAGGYGLSMIDPLDTSEPLQGTYVTLQPGGRYGSGGMLVENDILYTGTGEFKFGAAGYYLQTAAVGEAEAPTLLWSTAFDAPISDLQKEENLLYVGAADNLYIFDVNQPAAPVLLSVTPVGDFSSDWTFAVAGAYVYICPNGGCRPAVFFLDVSDPTAPEWLGEYPAPVPDPQQAFRIVATPGTLYLVLAEKAASDDIAEIYVVDVSDPAHATLLATVPPSLPDSKLGLAQDVVVDFPELYIFRGEYRVETVEVINVMNAGTPRRTATVAAIGHIPALTDGIIYLFGYAKVAIYAHPPLAPFPFMTTAAVSGGEVETAVAQEDLLFTGGVETGLVVYRFTLPAMQAAFFPEVGK